MRVHKVPAVGLGAAPLIGALFAIGWTPCIGPTYGVILDLTFAEATAARGALLAFCLRARARGPVHRRRRSPTAGTLAPSRWVRRHQVWVMRIGGVFLVLIGLAMVTGWWDHVVQWVQLRIVELRGDRRCEHDLDRAPGRPAASSTARELARWVWRQVTSMRTALVLLLLLALAAIPGSVIPQSGVDALEVTRWKDEHPKLTPIYEKLDLFSVYDSSWFSAIYLLLVLSLVGCIVPRTASSTRRRLRAQPPRRRAT